MSFKAGIFSPKQLDAMANCNARQNILEGSVRAGKTVATVIAVANEISKLPEGANILFAAKTSTTLYRNIISLMVEIYGSSRVQYSKGSLEGKIFGRTFYAVGANDEKAAGKIQGLTLAFAYCDEVSLFPESFYQMLLSRLSDHDAKLIATTNPDSPHHWLKKNYLDREDELNLKSWHFSIDENENLDKEYVESLKKEYTGLWYKRFILGLWVLAEGAIYDMFDDDKHVKPSDGGYSQYYVSCDYGTTNPCVFLMWGLIPGQKRHLIKEYYWDSKEEGSQKTDSNYADDMINFIGSTNVYEIIVDPSAASFIAELKTRGLNPTPANNDVIEGIMDVSTELERGIISIDPSCVETIKEFSGYVWDKKASDRGEDKPIKQSDHAMDCIRYFVKTVPLNPPEAVSKVQISRPSFSGFASSRPHF